MGRFIFEGTLRKHMFRHQREELGETIMDALKELPAEGSKCRLMYSCRNCGAIIYDNCSPFIIEANLHSISAGGEPFSLRNVVHICRNVSKSFKYYGICELIGFEEVPGDIKK